MNKTAELAGAEQTNFANPHGLDNPEHYTTARDLAKITGGEPLQKLFTVSVERKLCLLQITPATKLELAVDCGKITSPFSTEVCPINETELEIKSGTKEDLLAYVDEIAGLVPISAEERSKYERGMKLCGVNLK